MKPYFFAQFGNPSSSSHPYGWQAQDAVNEARIALALAINADPSEIIFTSGATESINLALKGLFISKGKKLISSSIEHSATLDTARFLNALGHKIVLIKPNHDGSISPELLREALDDECTLVSLSLVNNEVGTINDIASLSRLAKEYGALFHCDIAQAFGRLAIDCQELDADMLSLSGHKVYGPKGVGALYVRRSLMSMLCPLLHGGGQEWFKRSGTHNVPGIVGLGEAARLLGELLVEENERIGALRDQLWHSLQSLGGVHQNGSQRNRVAGNLNISFEGIDGEELILNLCHKLAVSTGSACASGRANHSHVLPELGLSPELCQATIRIGLGRFNTAEEIDMAAQLIRREVLRQRRQGG